MHHSMLPLIISCTRSWNFAWHLLWRSTTESKNIVKLLAISQTIHTVCCEDDYFPKGKFELFNSLFHSVYLVFPKSLFSIADLFAVRYLWVACNEDKFCVVTQRATDIRVAWLVTWLVYVRTYCVPIAALNQNKRTRLLYLGDAQIIIRFWIVFERTTLKPKLNLRKKFWKGLGSPVSRISVKKNILLVYVSLEFRRVGVVVSGEIRIRKPSGFEVRARHAMVCCGKSHVEPGLFSFLALVIWFVMTLKSL